MRNPVRCSWCDHRALHSGPGIGVLLADRHCGSGGRCSEFQSTDGGLCQQGEGRGTQRTRCHCQGRNRPLQADLPDVDDNLHRPRAIDGESDPGNVLHRAIGNFAWLRRFICHGHHIVPGAVPVRDS